MSDSVITCVVCPKQRKTDNGYLVCIRCSSNILGWLRELEEKVPTMSLEKAVKPDGSGTNTAFGPRSPANDTALFHTDPRSGPDYIEDEVKQKRYDKHGNVVLDAHGREVMDPIYEYDKHGYLVPVTRVREETGVYPAVSEVCSWADLVAEERGLNQCSGFMAAVEILRRNHDWICRQMWVDEYAQVLREIHFAVLEISGDPIPRSKGKCIAVHSWGDCQGKVYEMDDASGVRCSEPSCRRIYSGLDLARFNAAQEEAG